MEQTKEFDKRYGNQEEKSGEGQLREAGDTPQLEEKDVREGHGYDAYTSENPHVSDRKDDQLESDKSGF